MYITIIRQREDKRGYTYMCVYIYTHTHIILAYMYAYIHTHTNMYIIFFDFWREQDMRLRITSCSLRQVLLCQRIVRSAHNMRAYICMSTCICMCTCMCVYMYMHQYKYKYMYMCM
jgi:hypothetical protein